MKRYLITTKTRRHSANVCVGKIFFFLTLAAQAAFAQIELTPIWRTPPPNTSFKKEMPNARTSAALTPMLLPFWDDFSLNKFDGQRNTAYPNDTLWEYSQRVWVNDHMGINPPSIYVATFDGYDSLGKPYAKNDILAKGFADRLTSRPLRMDLVAQANRNNVFINFFYQIQGNGEVPDVGDVLYLYFKDKDGIWNEGWRIENDGKLDKTKFVEVKIPITDPKYFHNKFQFRFQNFGRISGPYDTWNLDYVYVSNGKTQYAPLYPNFPDRSIVNGLNSLFSEYQSIPVKHFRLSPTSMLRSPKVLLTNLRNDPAKQPINYSMKARITSRKSGILSTSNIGVSTNINVGSPLAFGELKERELPELTTLPNLASIDNQIDSISLTVIFNLDSSDHIIKPIKNGDWDTTVYKRIDFRHNDTTRTTYILGSYYAYDDGTAEYGARINGIGTQLAYEFNLKTTAADTIVAIDYYFPPFGDESTQSVQFHVLGALTGQETDYLYRRNTTITRKSNNRFVRENLASPVIVQGKFYIGWRLLSNALIQVGLDRSFDSGSKMFFNSSGDWIQNKDLKGSLMIRPVFIRKGQAPPPVAVADEPVAALYPNPNTGIFYLPIAAEQISIVDVTGRPVSTSVEEDQEQKKVSADIPMGIYVVRYFDGKWRSTKMLVKP
ncbi:MAG: T9SS type A sorting domain-containing protein [Bacteroidota bacterium]|nr:T9SS type A sorting domain-containing protein [Cytophagales bacterium]MCE2955623.1 T9SS type A sorting domain-containing protein [Flammeovirgaceae bacterium]MCZ8072005.1 T9SS type A sorting domain-containing protein [Cytophagales bacterium]